MPSHYSTLFDPGKRIMHVTILGIATLAENRGHTRYTVRYECCGREGNLSHGHLYGLAHSPSRQGSPIRRCRHCNNALAVGDRPAPRIPAIPVGDLWPIPPSLAPGRPARAVAA
jgi:hypothetical protein